MHRSTPEKHQLNDPKIINGWAMFDWANSSYALVITAAIFPIYFNSVIDPEFTFLGIEMTNTAIFSYSISFAYIIIVLSLPILSGIADYGGKRLYFMKFFTALGSLACICLFFFTGMENMWIGLSCSILAMIGFACGQVFYNSFLPIIASEDQLDRVSARGFSFGYIGSVILLIFNLVMIQKPEWFGMEAGTDLPARISFIMVGLWWIGFAQIPFRRLPKDDTDAPKDNLISKGFEELKKVWGEVKTQRNTKFFLLSFFFYSAGAQTVIFLASTFATQELKFEGSELIYTILILQIVAIFGAFIFAKVSGKWGNKASLITMLVIWMAICIMAYFVDQKFQFYIVAALVGLVMGGIQSLSRSTYSKLLPKDTEDTTSYFSFYDVLEKMAIVIGTFSFGFIELATGGMRNSILALSVFFLLGIIVLSTVKVQAAQKTTLT